MKFKIWKQVEIEVVFVEVHLPVRYGEEDIPNDFPLRTGDMWNAVIEMSTGKILDWPIGQEGSLSLKVCDEGVYVLFDAEQQELARKQDYVPSCVPGRYGDYVELEINEHGYVTNWPKSPDIDEFFPGP